MDSRRACCMQRDILQNWKAHAQSAQIVQIAIPVKKTAAKPLFWTVLSDLNSMRNEFPSDVINGGKRCPQNIPCRFKLSSSILEYTLSES